MKVAPRNLVCTPLINDYCRPRKVTELTSGWAYLTPGLTGVLWVSTPRRGPETLGRTRSSVLSGSRALCFASMPGPWEGGTRGARPALWDAATFGGAAACLGQGRVSTDCFWLTS